MDTKVSERARRAARELRQVAIDRDADRGFGQTPAPSLSDDLAAVVIEREFPAYDSLRELLERMSNPELGLAATVTLRYEARELLKKLEGK